MTTSGYGKNGALSVLQVNYCSLYKLLIEVSMKFKIDTVGNEGNLIIFLINLQYVIFSDV